ncbi:hypothetical protein HKD37_04G011203 [Glycine soja]
MEQSGDSCNRKKPLKIISIGVVFCSRASHIPSRPSIVKVSPPNIVGSLPYVIAVGMISQKVNISKRKQAIVPINHL